MATKKKEGKKQNQSGKEIENDKKKQDLEKKAGENAKKKPKPNKSKKKLFILPAVIFLLGLAAVAVGLYTGRLGGMKPDVKKEASEVVGLINGFVVNDTVLTENDRTRMEAFFALSNDAGLSTQERSLVDSVRSIYSLAEEYNTMRVYYAVLQAQGNPTSPLISAYSTLNKNDKAALQTQLDKITQEATQKHTDDLNRAKQNLSNDQQAYQKLLNKISAEVGVTFS